MFFWSPRIAWWSKILKPSMRSLYFFHSPLVKATSKTECLSVYQVWGSVAPSLQGLALEIWDLEIWGLVHRTWWLKDWLSVSGILWEAKSDVPGILQEFSIYPSRPTRLLLVPRSERLSFWTVWVTLDLRLLTWPRMSRVGNLREKANEAGTLIPTVRPSIPLRRLLYQS